MNQDSEVKSQVKEILRIIKQVAPGKSVELRIPPYSAIQCVTGLVHTRGTPPNVVEMEGEVLIELFQNPYLWNKFCSNGLISASGTSANIKAVVTKASKLGLGARKEK